MRRLLFLFLMMSLLPARAEEKRNVILMISDNHCWFDVGCYGNKVVKTPALDQLAAEGTRFPRRLRHHSKLWAKPGGDLFGLLTHSNGQYAHPHREHNQEIRPDVTTVFEMLKGEGYKTALIGKDHVRPLEKYPIDFKPKSSSYAVTTMAVHADNFMKECGDDPFFMVVSFHDPHPTSIDGTGWGVKRKVKGYEPLSYDPKEITIPPFLPQNDDVRQGIADYYQQVSRMDFGVGKVMEAIEENGRRDDTLIIFIADHGTSEPGAMGTHYEPGVRVPFIVRNPDTKKPGQAHKALVAFTDITPTILDWTGTSFEKYPLHGRSILPILDDPDAKGWDQALLSHVGHDIFAYYPMRTLRGRQYKLIWNINYRAEYPLPIDTVQRRTWVANRESGSKMIGHRTIEQFLHRPQLELYDLKSDPWEGKNLADDPTKKEVRDEMVAELVRRLEVQKDSWLRNYHPEKKGQ